MRLKFYVVAILSLILSFNAYAQDTVEQPQEKPQTDRKGFWGISLVSVEIKYDNEDPAVVGRIIIEDEDVFPEEASELRLFFGRQFNENLALIGYLGSYDSEERAVNDYGLIWIDTGNILGTRSTVSSDSYGLALSYSKPLDRAKKNHFYGNLGFRNDSRTFKVKLLGAGRVRDITTEKEKERGHELEIGIEANLSESAALRFGLISAEVISGLNIALAVNF